MVDYYMQDLHSPAGNLCCFQLFAAINNAAMNILMDIFLLICACFVTFYQNL